MEEVIKLIFASFFLFLGIPIGNILARLTKEELKDGKKYFIILEIIGLMGGVLGFLFKNDTLMFTMFFIAIVTSRSLVRKKKRGFF